MSGERIFDLRAVRRSFDRASAAYDASAILQARPRPDEARVYRANSMSGNFLECVRSRRPTICEPAIAAYTIRAILIGGIAMILKRPLRWDPVRAEFDGDAEANRLLSYTPRPPWRIGG